MSDVIRCCADVTEQKKSWYRLQDARLFMQGDYTTLDAEMLVPSKQDGDRSSQMKESAEDRGYEMGSVMCAAASLRE